MEVVFSKKSSALNESGERDYTLLCASTLRLMLNEKGLDVDGSREMLISPLEKG
jgi:hypothetical protein